MQSEVELKNISAVICRIKEWDQRGSSGLNGGAGMPDSWDAGKDHNGCMEYIGKQHRKYRDKGHRKGCTKADGVKMGWWRGQAMWRRR